MSSSKCKLIANNKKFRLITYINGIIKKYKLRYVKS